MANRQHVEVMPFELSTASTLEPSCAAPVLQAKLCPNGQNLNFGLELLVNDMDSGRFCGCARCALTCRLQRCDFRGQGVDTRVRRPVLRKNTLLP